MSDQACRRLGLLLSLVASLEKELSCLTPGDRSRLVTLHYWVTQLEEQAAGIDLPGPFYAAIEVAREWLEDGFASEKAEAALVAKFKQWNQWMRQAVVCVLRSERLPEWPREFVREPSQTLQREFTSEAIELLDKAEAAALEWAGCPSDSKAFKTLVRHLHTLKATTGFLNLAPAAALIHSLESILGNCASTSQRFNASLFDLLLKSVFLLRQSVSNVEYGDPVEKVSQAMQNSVENLQHRMYAVGAQSPAPGGLDPVTRPASDAGTATHVRVDTEKLDSFLHLFNHWQEAHAQLAQAAWGGGVTHNQALFRNLSHLYELGKDLEMAAVSLRCTTLRRTFARLEWLVSFLAAKVGKLVRVQAKGQDFELDIGMVAELDTILMHLVRNAVDHGLEKPELRRAAGKSETGTIWLSVESYEEAVIIELRDDGVGLNEERIWDCAVERGLVARETKLSEREILDLVLSPGFSTAGVSTEISGRGIGLDLVKASVERLNGALEIGYTKGLGMTFQIYLVKGSPSSTSIAERGVSTRGAQRAGVDRLPNPGPEESMFSAERMAFDS